MATTTRARARVPRIAVTPRTGPRDPLEVPTKYRKPGRRYRWVRMGSDPSETDSIIEEMTERGMRLVTKDGKPDSAPVRHRDMILFDIDERTYTKRMEERVRENVRQNKAQAVEIREQLRGRISPRGERPKVLERGIEREAAEPLLTDRERFENEQPEA